MEEIQKAIELAFEKWNEENGEGTFEDGDEFVTVFNNCCLLISLENGQLTTKFIGGKLFECDVSLSMYYD